MSVLVKWVGDDLLLLESSSMWLGNAVLDRGVGFHRLEGAQEQKNFIVDHHSILNNT